MRCATQCNHWSRRLSRVCCYDNSLLCWHASITVAHFTFTSSAYVNYMRHRLCSGNQCHASDVVCPYPLPFMLPPTQHTCDRVQPFWIMYGMRVINCIVQAHSRLNTQSAESLLPACSMPRRVCPHCLSPWQYERDGPYSRGDTDRCLQCSVANAKLDAYVPEVRDGADSWLIIQALLILFGIHDVHAMLLDVDYSDLSTWPCVSIDPDLDSDSDTLHLDTVSNSDTIIDNDDNKFPSPVGPIALPHAAVEESYATQLSQYQLQISINSNAPLLDRSIPRFVSSRGGSPSRKIACFANHRSIDRSLDRSTR